ncbi:MAG TPA: hypothetical protein VFE51_15495 [Verrucomicrobiae bacterium]|nr:hypothetical protein [Verrucomicrobiae bacterium]
MSAKEAVLQAIHRLPDDVDFRAIAEEIAFLAALEHKGNKTFIRVEWFQMKTCGRSSSRGPQADLV